MVSRVSFCNKVWQCNKKKIGNKQTKTKRKQQQKPPNHHMAVTIMCSAKFEISSVCLDMETKGKVFCK